MLRTGDKIELAGNWFLHSGIQESNGGVARFYRFDVGQNAPVSTEITGYSLSILLFLNQRTGDSAYLDAAVRAAKFLTRNAWDAGLSTFPFELRKNGTEPPALTYFFDTGIIVRGLLQAWRLTEDDAYRQIAVRAGRGMLADFPSAQGIHPILALPEKRPLPWEPRWSAGPGCYQLKSALAWRELFHITGEEPFLSAYESALTAALQNYREFLPGAPDQYGVMDRLHAYSYFLEGLLPVLDRPECAEAFCDGVLRAEKYLREIAPVFARSDVYAQLLRVRLLGQVIGSVPLDERAAAYEAEQAAGFQIASDDPRIAGGFLFGRKHGEAMAFANPVSTAFCVQALAMWDDYRAGRLDAAPHDVI